MRGATTNPPSWLKYLNGSPRKLHGGDFLWTRLFNKTEVDTHGTTAMGPPRQRETHTVHINRTARVPSNVDHRTTKLCINSAPSASTWIAAKRCVPPLAVQPAPMLPEAAVPVHEVARESQNATSHQTPNSKVVDPSPKPRIHLRG